MLFVTDDRCRMHVAGPHHPERPERLVAVVDGIERAGLREVLVPHVPAPAPIEALERVHDPAYVAAVRAFCLTGGGNLDADTGVVPASYEAALLAAGSGLDAIDALRAGRVDAALCAVRPPGHHARPASAMGFCLFNNIAVAAASLAADGERVLIVDVDVHHGNGTEDIFKDDPRVMLCSTFQHPFYPFSGADSSSEHIVNVPLPAGTTGKRYREVFEAEVLPRLEAFQPEMLFISAGFDAHREDDMGQFGLMESDYIWITERIMEIARRHARDRIVSVLEGGYDLSSLGRSVAAHMKVLADL